MSEENYNEELMEKKKELAEAFDNNKVGNIVSDIFYNYSKNLFDFGAKLIKNLTRELGSIENRKK